MRIALVAGEQSGDGLAAALIGALRALHPDAEFIGMTGPQMRAAGCRSLGDIDELSLMGLVEVLRHLPRLLRLRRRLVRDILAARPDVFVGIDAAEFNLSLARRFKARGLATVQYVSPQVWAWRQGRVRSIARDCDLVLCLLPFEPGFYREHAVHAEFVGHPFADQIPLQSDRVAARAALGLPASGKVVALLPGSRRAEVQSLGADFLGAARWLAEREPGLNFVAPMANARVQARFEAQWQVLGGAAAPSAGRGPSATAPLSLRIVPGHAREALAAADVALVASGTATLEALLCGTPLVVAYRLSPLTAWLLRTLRLVRLQNFSLPNLLAGERLVPEFFQEQAQPATLGAALRDWLAAPGRCALLRQRFAAIHQQLRTGGAGLAAAAISRLLAQRARGSAT
ncbi:MAG TPA: lipid-A-disaccharide synthase [Steroidobacteraceae bacterium]|nr:lipid-A-disaccharide synthase [Steroidobacteraceae bacterium]